MKTAVLMSILLIMFLITIPLIVSFSEVSASSRGTVHEEVEIAHYPSPGYPSPPSTFYLAIVQNKHDGSRQVPEPTATPLPSAPAYP